MTIVATIILAAGESSRMGTSKQLLEVKGKTLLERIIDIAMKLKGGPTVVVLGANANVHAPIVANYPDVLMVVNDEWPTGLGSSIRAGLSEALRAESQIDAALFLVCDQPHVSLEHLQKMMNEHDTRGASIVASGYKNTEGVPALFTKIHFAELLHLQNHEGAKRVIGQTHEQKSIIPFPLGGIDLDTPSDLRDYLNELK